MTTTQINADNLLQEAYEQLEFKTSEGWYRITDPTIQLDLAQIGWFEQARQLGAETVFFVQDYPVVLFFKLDLNLGTDTEKIEDEIRKLFVKIWNTGRAALFFVALPDELRVYSAYQKPVQDLQEWRSKRRWLERVKTIAQVAELQEFSRPAIESGHLFKQRARDFKREDRVDQWLLKNLRLLRQKLEDGKREKREYVHALIGRSIFIRYLEDRKVLIKDYFTDINPQYQGYRDVLVNKEDTYHLFRKLRDDFNGNLFPLSDEEEKVIEVDDLRRLRDFLLGRSMADQPDLLFWAYQFDLIPVELISNIYEEFYHEQSEGKDEGTHYTPTPLVDFVLSQALTPARLDAGARVLDPACGSGIFLVEAFKRMVYHECLRRGIGFTQLPREDLTNLLTEKIVGVDVNKAAIQVAAFSLYLAFLDFREPPDIRKHKQLPNLVYNPNQPNSGQSLFHANIFYLTPLEKADLQKRAEQKKTYKGRAVDERLINQTDLPLDNFQFDVIVGNPPWGGDDSPDHQLATEWCGAFHYPVGDKELSQCFMWRVQQLLKPDGEIGLLVSTGVFFKHQDKSKDFRQQWLKQNRVRAVYNFAHVRHVFFRKQNKESIAPFAAVFFTSGHIEENPTNRVSYISIKQSTFIDQLQVVVIDKTDIRKVRQSEFLINDWLWKTYIWGGVSDVELIEELKSFYDLLGKLVDGHGRGYQEGGGEKKYHTDELGVAFELPTSLFEKNQQFSELYIPLIPRNIHALGQPKVYKGPRLLIKRGISRSGKKLGEIFARLAYEPFAFKNSLIGICLNSFNDNQRRVILGIIQSSLAKYYHFLTCSTWGFWHDEIHVEEHLNLPIRLPNNQEIQDRILRAIKDFTIESDDTPTLIDSNIPDQQQVQDELDEAIFDLYELSEPQRDLVRDLCQVTLEFFYDGPDSAAVKPPSQGWLEAYAHAFLETWQERLAAQGQELEVIIYAPRNGWLCGLSFELRPLGRANPLQVITDNTEWRYWFRSLSKSLQKEYSTGIYINQVVKELSDSGMLIIKRAERRLWTKSQAHQDAQELLTEVFKLEWQRNRRPADELGIAEPMG